MIDDGWDAVRATIRLDPRFGPEALRGLDAFSDLRRHPGARLEAPHGKTGSWARELMAAYW